MSLMTQTGGVTAPETAAKGAPTVRRWDRVSGVFVALSGVAAVGLALVPLGFTPNVTETLTGLFVLMILATMWNTLAGFGGLVSIGQQAFIGIGAYATIAMSEQGLDPYLAVLAAAVFAGLVALPTSVLVFRLSGGQFAIGMWVVAEVFRLVVTNIESLGGGTGKSLTALNVYEPATRQANTYWLALSLLGVLLTAVVVLLRSRLGSALQAIRDDEVGAASLGVRVMTAKRVVFLLAAVGCGAAGGLIVASTLRIQPSSIFGVQWTAYMIFMVLLGGLGTFEGPLVGALLFFGVQELFADEGSWYLIALGLVAMAMAVLARRGVWGTLVDRFQIRLVPVGYRVDGLRRSPGTETHAQPDRGDDR